MTLLVPGVLLMALATALAACGGGGDDSGAALGRDALRRMLLTQAELGSQYDTFTLNTSASGYVTSSFGVGEQCPSDGTPEPGPLEAYGNQFESSGNLAGRTGTFLIVEGVDHFVNADAASDGLAAFLSNTADHITVSGCPEHEITDEDDFDPAGLEGQYGGVEQDVEQTNTGGGKREFTITAVGFVNGRILGKVLIAHYDSPGRRTEAASIAAMLAERVESVLSGGGIEETPRGSLAPTPSGQTPQPSPTGGASGSPGPSGSGSPTPGAGARPPTIASPGCSPTQATPNETITCTPSISGNVTSRSWSTSGGSPSSGTDETFQTTFASPGEKVITLRACNSAGCTASQQNISLSAASSAPGAPSVGSLDCAPTTLNAGATVTCNPSVSGTVTSWSWTAEGGSPGTGSGSSFATSFSTPGGKKISLKACNGGDCTNSSQTITVNAAPAGKYVVSITSGQVSPGETVTVTVSVQAPTAGLGSYDIDVSYDPQVLSPQSCTDHFGGACDMFAFDNTVSTAGHAGSSGNLTIATITFGVAGFSCCQSALTLNAFSLKDVNGNAVTNIEYANGSITVNQ